MPLPMVPAPITPTFFICVISGIIRVPRVKRQRQASAYRSVTVSKKFVYRINMRKAISITLSTDNLLWLRGQAARSARGSVSELVNQLVAEARQRGRTDPSAVTSVIGTIDL